MFKRIIAVALVLAMAFTLGACSNAAAKPSASAAPAESASAPVTTEQTPASKQVVKIAALKGPTAMGLVKLMQDDEQDLTANDYEFTVAGTTDEVVGAFVKGEFDVAVVPSNLGSVLYNKTEGKVAMLAAVTLGTLYIVENGDTIKSVADLAGKTIYSTGKGATPEFALNYILAQNGLTDKVSVEYKTEHTELAALLAQGSAELALLPQPFVASALAANDKLRIAINLSEEWNKSAGDGGQMTMSAVIVRQEFLEQSPQAITALLAEYGASVAYVTDKANLAAAAALCEKYDIIKAAVAEKALPDCNIVFITGEEMKQKESGFLTVLFNADAASVGGKLPDDAFYYIPAA